MRKRIQDLKVKNLLTGIIRCVICFQMNVLRDRAKKQRESNRSVNNIILLQISVFDLSILHV